MDTRLDRAWALADRVERIVEKRFPDVTIVSESYGRDGSKGLRLTAMRESKKKKCPPAILMSRCWTKDKLQERRVKQFADDFLSNLNALVKALKQAEESNEKEA